MLFFTLFNISRKKIKRKFVNDDELKKDLEEDQLYDAFFAAKKKLDLDIQNFENPCFSVNDLLNENGLFLRGLYQLKDKFQYFTK